MLLMKYSIYLEKKITAERNGNILLDPLDFNHGMYIIRVRFESEFNSIKILR